MRKILIVLTLVFVAIAANAQDDSFNKGYRGYSDLGYTIGVGDYEFGRFQIQTTHGYQVCPYFFVGGGVGFHFMQSYKTKGMDIALDERKSKVSIPLFADFRSTFSKSKFAPFVDLKLGHYVTNSDGFYGNISAGCRMALKGKQAVSLAIGYTYEKLQYETFDSFTKPGHNMDYTRSNRKLDSEGVTIKLGYEF